MSGTPRLTVGLPVYNGDTFLAQSIEALLSQTFEDFELIISDNASTDGTAEVCELYARQDSRVRYVRQPHNIGGVGNHNFVAEQASGELFKWASHDDLYARELLERCVDALDAVPDAVLAHSWTAMIDSSNAVTFGLEYPLATASPRAPERFRSALFDRGGDDFYGVMRRKSLPTSRKGSHHRNDRTMVAGWTLYGPFTQVPEWLYFRREHPELRLLHQNVAQTLDSCPERDWPVGRGFAVKGDPRRANRIRYPMARLYGEYVYAYVAAIRSAPLSSADRAECYRYLAQWVASRAHLASSQAREAKLRPPEGVDRVDDSVARWEKRAS
jgi:glycosyltransferase involved in cell wall biosynthesis